ncbi:MAG: hypothetical protein HZC40_14950 [Chloroflexi bacterium]|nr:hypothetical protein [Chloroflexota bacterium]
MSAMFVGYGMVYHDTPAVVSIFFVFLLIYLCADQFLPRRAENSIKFFMLTLIIGLFVVGAMIGAMLMRHSSAPHQFVHDGLIQIEQATRFLLAGKNPYVEDYTQTPLANWLFEISGTAINPALYHNAYLPFFFVFTAPFYLFANASLGWFDGRMIFLPMFLAVLVLLAQAVSDRNKKYALLFFVTLNPFFTRYLIEGRNDVFVLFWIVLGAHLLRQRREKLALIAVGLACASKLTAWFLAPFFALYLLQPSATSWGAWLAKNYFVSFRRLMPLVLTLILVVGPFALWDLGAFVDDVWNYPNGTSAIAPYPIHGYGFNIFLRELGLLSSGASRSPVEMLQWIIGLPLFGWLAWRQVKRNTLAQMWFGYALLVAVMGYFSHVLNDNHIGFVLTLIAIALLSDDPARARESGRDA